MAVIVSRRAPRSVRLDPRRVARMAERMLGALGRAEDELSILLTDDPTIHELNRTHRAKDRPTDVLAFALLEGAKMPASSHPILLGDVVISLDTAARQAKARRWTAVEEVRFLLAHGILHLVGYDHRTAREERLMTAATVELVATAGGDPSAAERRHVPTRPRPKK